jgi:hypothetical protein
MHKAKLMFFTLCFKRNNTVYTSTTNGKKPKQRGLGQAVSSRAVTLHKLTIQLYNTPLRYSMSLVSERGRTSSRHHVGPLVFTPVNNTRKVHISQFTACTGVFEIVYRRTLSKRDTVESCVLRSSLRYKSY